MLFSYCPHCGAKQASEVAQGHFVCPLCEFQYFHNVAAATAIFIVHEQKLLLVKRGKAPQQGFMDVPGDFVDPSETALACLQRECSEELSLRLPKTPNYLGAWPNPYFYGGVNYHTLALFYWLELTHYPQLVIDNQEISQYQWLSMDDIDADLFAFSSAKQAFKVLKTRV
jgi:NADH pyrophosphatase NudC (nudix superfamily)